MEMKVSPSSVLPEATWKGRREREKGRLKEKCRASSHFSPEIQARLPPSIDRQYVTHHAVLYGESQLVLGVRPLDLHLDDGRAGDGGQLHGRLVFGILRKEQRGCITSAFSLRN